MNIDKEIKEMSPEYISNLSESIKKLSFDSEESMNRYFETIGNPYCFKCGNITVELKFSENGKSLASCLIEYFRSLKNC